MLTDNNSTRNVWPITVAILMTIVAFSYAVKNTHDLQWPGEVDFFRDMGAVQSILENKGTADPLFYDEVRWYNPAVPTIVASIVKLSDQPLSQVYAQVGPYLNLLGPIAFFIFCRFLIGNWPAVFALSAYLFLGNHAAFTWHQATYSAWAWPWNVAQGVFFITATVLLTTYRLNSYLWAIVAGFFLGLTLLFHTAPAFILTLLVTIITIKRLLNASSAVEIRQQITLYSLIGFTSILVALPFLGPLALEYGFVIKNREPTKYVAMGFSEVISYCFNIRFVVFLVTFAVLWTRPAITGLSNTVIGELRTLSTLVVTLLLVAFGIQYLRAFNIDLPQLYPSFHFHIYFKIVEALLFGLGVCLLSSGFVTVVFGTDSNSPLNDARSLAVSTASIVVYLGLVFTNYTQRVDFIGTNKTAMYYAEKNDEIALYDWLLSDTSIDDVFLAEGDARLFSVSAAGRKVMVHDGVFTSPYVNFEQRWRDQQLIYDALKDQNLESFATLAKAYSIDYIIINNQLDAFHNSKLVAADVFEQVFTTGLYHVYRYHSQH